RRTTRSTGQNRRSWPAAASRKCRRRRCRFISMRCAPCASRCFAPGSLRLEVHRHAVNAVARVGRGGAVLQNVAEMAAAAAAMHLGADHAPTAIGGALDRARLRIVKTRPAGAAVELGLGDEQRLAAAGAGERAGTLLVIERATARPFGAVLAHDVELL